MSLDIFLLWQWLLQMEVVVVGPTFLPAGFIFSCTNPACLASSWAVVTRLTALALLEKPVTDNN